MKHQHIHTKLHLLANYVDQDRHNAPGASHVSINKMLKSASYVFDSEVVGLLRREDCGKSILAMIEAGIARLPYPQMVVEYVTGENNRFQEIILLEEGPNESILATYAMHDNKHMLDLVTDRPIIVRPTASMPSEGIPMFQQNARTPVIVGRPGFLIDEAPANRAEQETMVTACLIAAQLAFLMLNTKGVEKQTVHVDALNKARAKSGKTSIPRHTVVHIGTIYRRDGSSVSRNSATGRTMPMHVRQAHTRRQHFGKGREEVKIVFIPMCIVNYKEGAEAPAPKREVRV